MKYFDTHCHLNGAFYETETIDNDLLNAVERFVNRIILPGTNEEDSLLGIEMSKKSPNLFAAAGVHPSDAVGLEVTTFLDGINPKDIVAFGETGIDLHYSENPPLEKQIQVFEKHIGLAKIYDLPLIVHSRDALEITYDILKKHEVSKFVMHAYSGSVEWALKFIALGGYISFSGVVTFKNADELREVAKAIPLDRIVCETDSPFLAPVPHRGKNNKPEYVRNVVDMVAMIREEDDQKVIDQIYENSCKLFNI